MKKLILDVDTGIDDAFAILYALAQSQQAELIGITTSFGNVQVKQATQNTLQILELFQAEIPVYIGADRPLGATAYRVPSSFERVHGKNGIGEYRLDTPKTNPQTLNASEFLIHAARTYQEELIIVTLGPLTNLATAIKNAPEVMQNVGKVVCMAGAITLPGNITPFAEVNVYNDPMAAKLVFEQIDTTLVGLDVTLQTMITQTELQRFDINEKTGAFLAHIATYYYQNEYESQEYGGALHDPLAVAIALDESLATETFAMNLTVDTGGIEIGRMTGNLAELRSTHKRTTVCLGIQADKFVERFMSSLLEFSAHNNK